MSYVVFDIETTTHTSFKRKANPFDERNWTVLAGWKRKGEKPQSRRYAGREEAEGHALLKDLLDPVPTLLVGQNIKFDLLHVLRNPVSYRAWQRYVAKGGLVWDVQLAEYLLEGQAQSSHMLSLDELAVRYGADTKVDEVKALWDAGVPTEEIDPDLLHRYLMGEDLPGGERREGDIGNTEHIFLKQLERARKAGQVKSILMNMGALIATTEMERNGMFVNQPLGHELAKALEAKLAESTVRLNGYLPDDCPFPLSWTNRYHLSPVIFGGTVKYQARVWKLEDDTEVLQKLWSPDTHAPIACPMIDELHYVLVNGETMECGKYDAWAGGDPMNWESEPPTLVIYGSGKQKGEPKTKKVKVPDRTRPKSAERDFYFEFSGYTQPEKEWASSTAGLFSVSADVVEALGNRNIPFLKDLASVKSMDKDLGTYFIRLDSDGQPVGMLTLVQPDSIIHHMLNHTSTVTGRFSSSNPNLQNIPKGNKSDAKQMFESRFGKDGVILQSDFSSLEIYVQAILTGCANLIADLKAGIDLHCMRLALKEGMSYEEVFKLCKGYTDKEGVYHEAVSEWDYKRTGAKVFSFQRAYGAGAKKISVSTGMPLEEVEALIAAEEERYPEITKYFDKRTEQIKRNRVPTNRFVPHPDLRAVMCQLGVSHVRTPDNKMYTYNETPSPEYLAKRGIFQSFSPTEVKNYEVQGEGGEWMKAALWLMVRAFYERENFGGKALLVNTVHDASYVDAHDSVRNEAAALLHACMEAASDFMEWYFDWKLPLPVPSDTVWGRNMGEENKFNDAAFKAAAAEERAALRAAYMANHKPSYL